MAEMVKSTHFPAIPVQFIWGVGGAVQIILSVKYKKVAMDNNYPLREGRKPSEFTLRSTLQV